MQVRILGSAAGGGFPQWNCACPNCQAVRGGRFAGKRRLQTQVAVSADGASWFLLGASPDLRCQIESSTELQPRGGSRSSPIEGVVLASSDLDHVLGLLLLREMHPFLVWGAESVLSTLRSQNTMFTMLNRVADQVRWNQIRSGEPFGLKLVNGESSGITCEPRAVWERLPAYANRATAADAVLGLVLIAPSGKKLGFFPQIASVTTELRTLFANLDGLLLDGTFWSDDELIRLQGTGQSAREMGHLPVGGENGTLQQLAGLTQPRKMYIHVNNTNPMLNEAGPEFRAVCDAGWNLAEEGCQFTL